MVRAAFYRSLTHSNRAIIREIFRIPRGYSYLRAEARDAWLADSHGIRKRSEKSDKQVGKIRILSARRKMLLRVLYAEWGRLKIDV